MNMERACEIGRGYDDPTEFVSSIDGTRIDGMDLMQDLSLDFVYESWRVNESSDAPTGLPWRWAIKSVIPITFGLLVVAAVSRAVRIIHSLRGE